MLLASVSDIREGLGFEDMPDINNAITVAINAAEPHLASVLNTSFARAEAIDTFWVPEPTVIDGPHHTTHFWLSRGFIAGTPTVTGIDGAQAAMEYDREKGIARDWTTRYSRTTLVFAYQYGFEEDPSEQGQYNLDQVPKWLQEAAKLLAQITLSTSPSVIEAGISIDVNTLKEQSNAAVLDHIRYAPLALMPL